MVVILKGLLIAALSCYAVLALGAWLLADRMIFLPPRASYDSQRLPLFFVDTDDGARIAVRHLPNPEARYTLLFSHGNAEDLGHLEDFLQRLRDSGYAVLAYDYRGYGLSRGGPPTATGAQRDLAAVYAHATQELGVAADRIVLHGRSVGSGPAIWLAARRPVGGLIVESGFLSAFRVLTRAPLLPFDRFPNARILPTLRCPVLVIHGGRDAVIAPYHGRKLYALAPEPRRLLWVEAAGHNDLFAVAGADYLQALTEFRELLDSRAAASCADARGLRG